MFPYILEKRRNRRVGRYLTGVPTPLAEVLIGLIGREVTPIALAGHDVKPVPADDLDYWERKLEQELVDDPTVRETERQAIIRARNGQGLLREGEQDRIKMPDYGSRKSSASGRKSLQAVAGLKQ